MCKTKGTCDHRRRSYSSRTGFCTSRRICSCASSSSIPSSRCDTWSWMYAFLMRRALIHAGSCVVADSTARLAEAFEGTASVKRSIVSMSKSCAGNYSRRFCSSYLGDEPRESKLGEQQQVLEQENGSQAWLDLPPARVIVQADQQCAVGDDCYHAEILSPWTATRRSY